MDVLVIGGGIFVGQAMIGEALAAGARVAVFNRGRSGRVADGVEHVIGDRTVADDLAKLRGRRFDLVLDTSGYVPADVTLAAETLASSGAHYVFVSSINAYPGWPELVDYQREAYDGDPDATADGVPVELGEGAAYGWLKVGCERAVARAFGAERTTVLRAGAIVGPGDKEVARLPWWIDRVGRGGEVLVPGAADAPVSLVDARDLARFALSAVAGTFEISGTGRDTRADVLAACVAATRADPQFTYVDEAWLAEQDVVPWTEIPLWAPAPGLFRGDPSAAAAAGMTWRPLDETVRDTRAWMTSLPQPWTPSAMTPGLAPERERELLARWHVFAR